MEMIKAAFAYFLHGVDFLNFEIVKEFMKFIADAMNGAAK